MKKLLSYIRGKKYYAQARIIVNAQNIKGKIGYAISREKRNIVINKDIKSKNVLLLAMYEKEYVRNDILRLFEEAKNIGMDIIAVNTLKLNSENIEKINKFVDCYIERKNYGRDFGSYKEGFMYIYNNGLDKSISRLLMMNDSVFYSKKQLSGFLKCLLNSPIPVTGATENFEISYHLGSFCIAFDGDIIRNEKFKEYWRSYKLTDIRPKVIKRGEMRLTKTLLKIAGSQGVESIYSSAKFANHLEDIDFLNYVIKIKTKDKVHWKKPYIFEPIQMFLDDYIRYARKYKISIKRKDMDKGIHKELSKAYILHDIDSISKFIEEKYNCKLQSLHINILTKYMNHHFLEVFRSGSQIHRNAPVLLRMGCAIVKIDGLYRGLFNDITISYILDNMDDDREELREILYSRPFGGETLTKWKLAAFNRGLI